MRVIVTGIAQRGLVCTATMTRIEAVSAPRSHPILVLRFDWMRCKVSDPELHILCSLLPPATIESVCVCACVCVCVCVCVCPCNDMRRMQMCATQAPEPSAPSLEKVWINAKCAFSAAGRNEHQLHSLRTHTHTHAHTRTHTQAHTSTRTHASADTGIRCRPSQNTRAHAFKTP